jgi:hypothetical protein
MAKFAPLALAPLYATYTAGRRDALRTLLAVAAVVAGALALVLILDGGLGTFWKQTVAFQADRDSPFSLWGLYDLPLLQRLVQVAAAVLAVAVAFVPRRRDAISLAALTGAVLLGLQLGVSHWFYLYVVWFLPFVLIASVGEVMRSEAPAAAPARSPRRAAVPART